LDLAFGSDLITRFEEFEFTNPIFVGDQPSLILECGRTMGPGPFTILFTKPDGSQYVANPAFPYDEQSSPVVAPRGRCFPQTYVVYVFAPNEINQFGVWSVVVSVNTFTSALGKFTVLQQQPTSNSYTAENAVSPYTAEDGVAMYIAET
jgi:hypothetical protein